MPDEGPQPASDPGGTPTGTPPAATTPPAPDDAKRFTQAELDAIVRDRLDRERRKADEQTKRAMDEAEAKKLAEQNEFKALADRHAARVAELEPQAQQAERYEAALRAHLEAQRQGLPAHIVALLDAVGDPVKQLDWISAHHAELRPAAGPTGVPATPRAAGAPTPEDEVRKAQQELQATGRYRL